MEARNNETVTIKAPLPHRQRAAPKGTENRDILMSTPFLVSADTSTSGIAIAEEGGANPDIIGLIAVYRNTNGFLRVIIK